MLVEILTNHKGWFVTLETTEGFMVHIPVKDYDQAVAVKRALTEEAK